MPSGSGATELLMRVRLGMTPSLSQTGQRGTNPVASHRNDGNKVDASVLARVPPEIVRALVRKYFSVFQPHYPLIDADALRRHVEVVGSSLGWPLQQHESHDSEINRLVVPSHHFLIAYLVLAIALTVDTIDAVHETRCMSLSTSLFTEGVAHLNSLSTCPSDITWVQAILLATLYATIVPRSANVWVLSGVAMRTCVELGLHRELPTGIMASHGPDDKETRRLVFWTAYCIDRSICSSLQRPLTTLDATIDTQLPKDSASEAFLGSIEYHQLLSEMTQIHFQAEPLPQQFDWDGWLTDMERRLRQWHLQRRSDTKSIESPDFALSRGLMILHRPSPRVPRPSEASLLMSFEAACTAACAYREQIASGSLRRLWISAHYTLEAAMVVLFCLRHGCNSIRTKFAPHKILDMTKLLTVNFVMIADQGWPEASAYAGIYERLLGTLLEPVLSPSALSCFSPAQDAELLRLLYPSPARLEKLRLGHNIQQAEGDWPLDSDIWDTSWQLFDFESLAEPTFDQETELFNTSQWILSDNTGALDLESAFMTYDPHENF
ncbi:hypothetical protein H2204_003593 [Knufia peltigerae]|uniref:Xylanolytic transcriptional activator regulatory domain-containing protein n=1 Tax=Knufia peltigerae TaxID=1002370 RepID=A0AA38Y930_9EURO|nr:hypothetical protein H2204_003593 [Knufia peltigerae]